MQATQQTKTCLVLHMTSDLLEMDLNRCVPKHQLFWSNDELLFFCLRLTLQLNAVSSTANMLRFDLYACIGVTARSLSTCAHVQPSQQLLFAVWTL